MIPIWWWLPVYGLLSCVTDGFLPLRNPRNVFFLYSILCKIKIFIFLCSVEYPGFAHNVAKYSPLGNTKQSLYTCLPYMSKASWPVFTYHSIWMGTICIPVWPISDKLQWTCTHGLVEPCNYNHVGAPPCHPRPSEDIVNGGGICHYTANPLYVIYFDLNLAGCWNPSAKD